MQIEIPYSEVGLLLYALRKDAFKDESEEVKKGTEELFMSIGKQYARMKA